MAHSSHVSWIQLPKMHYEEARRGRRERELEQPLGQKAPRATSIATIYTSHRAASDDDAEWQKTAYLHGVLNLYTSKMKTVPAIQAEVARALKQIRVQYIDIPGGFICQHTPSWLKKLSTDGSPSTVVKFRIDIVNDSIGLPHIIRFQQTPEDTDLSQFKDVAGQIMKELKL